MSVVLFAIVVLLAAAIVVTDRTATLVCAGAAVALALLAALGVLTG